MKKFARILCLTLVAVMLCATLASCGGPAADPADAKAALKDNGYKAEVVDSALALGFYTALGIEKLDCVIIGTNTQDLKQGVTIYYFEDADAAKAGYEKINSAIYEKLSAEDKEGVTFKRSGDMVYYGTKDAIKAAK